MVSTKIREKSSNWEVLNLSVHCCSSLCCVQLPQNHTPGKLLGKIFHVDSETLRQDHDHILPILTCFLSANSRIRWPDKMEREKLPSWRGAIGAIDCKSHYRNRVHPVHSWYYRGDKHDTFVSCQMVCSLDGSQIFSIDLVRGHLNDQAALNMTGMADYLASSGTVLLGDGGYKHGNIIAPRDVDKGSLAYQQYQRGVCENVNGQNDCWGVSSSRFRGSAGKQLLSLRSTWDITGLRLEESPLRPFLQAIMIRQENPTPILSSCDPLDGVEEKKKQ